MINWAISDALANALCASLTMGNLISPKFFNGLALTWTVRLMFSTRLHMTPEKASRSNSSATKTEFADEVLSIFYCI